MKTQSRPGTVRRRPRRRFLAAFLAVLACVAACGAADESREAPESPPADSANVARDAERPPDPPPPWPVRRRPPEDTVGITATLDEFAIRLSPNTIDPGNVSLRLQNDGERPHVVQILGDNGMRWVSTPIRPGGSVTMRMSIGAGEYAVTSRDSAYVERGMRARFRVR